MPKLRADLSARRLNELVEAGLQVFCQRGYERAQIADVAKAMGCAVGTVYLYAEGKEALFDLVIRHAAAADASWLSDLEVPVKTPEPGSTLEFLRAQFEATEWPVLEAALASGTKIAFAEELRGILSEQYRLIRRHRRGLLLLTRSALEFPGLSEVFVIGLRNKLLDQLCRYLETRIDEVHTRVASDIRANAALLIQSLTWANLQRPLDPGLADLDDELFESTTLDFCVRAILRTEP